MCGFRLLALAIVAVAGSSAPGAQRPPVNIPSAGVTRFSFFAYGDTRSASGPQGDGDVLHPEHSKLVDLMIARAKSLASTPFPARFVVQSGDAVLRGGTAGMWNVSFTPIISRLTGADNPHHFIVVQVDGDRLSVEVIGSGPDEYRPYGGRTRLDLQ